MRNNSRYRPEADQRQENARTTNRASRSKTDRCIDKHVESATDGKSPKSTGLAETEGVRGGGEVPPDTYIAVIGVPDARQKPTGEAGKTQESGNWLSHPGGAPAAIESAGPRCLSEYAAHQAGRIIPGRVTKNQNGGVRPHGFAL
jgi:hypothetical protein